MSIMNSIKFISLVLLTFSYSYLCEAQEINSEVKPLTPKMESFIQGNWCLGEYKVYHKIDTII